MTISTLPKTKTKTKFFTAAQFAEQAGCNVETIYRWARTGKIGFCPKLPGQRYYRFLQKHIDDFFNGVAPAPVLPALKSSRHPRYSK
ncbi:MAG TPA: helix-turn-helix domain-containing protein [Trebonia sp.]